MLAPSDTSRAAAAIQIELLRGASAGARARAMRSLSTTAIALSRRALRESMPNATEEQLLLRWVGLHYGADLARAVAGRLAAK